jgi:hypothetical protein
LRPPPAATELSNGFKLTKVIHKLRERQTVEIPMHGV